MDGDDGCTMMSTYLMLMNCMDCTLKYGEPGKFHTTYIYNLKRNKSECLFYDEFASMSSQLNWSDGSMSN